ncbi:MAG: bifunctional glutamate N-acetyltransferase/amino-acid acetyltransferase ArgJ [bacterium]|nr:bifunctional glutamate N-acetyltransferase/amino-acid acetyltransferase ArgJ [bacterium]
MNTLKEGVTAPQGFLASGINCGIKEKKFDLALIYSKIKATTACLYTTNKLKSAPIVVTKEHLWKNKKASAIIINSGNANTCNGIKGIKDAKAMAVTIASYLNFQEKEVLVASTGIIGTPLPIKRITRGTKELVNKLSENGGHDAALAIMTTDTVPKEYSCRFKINNKVVTIGGMCKGAGMIHPKLATTLAFITTDISINYKLLKEALKNSVAKSLNLISIDGDTSPNDMVAILANGKALNDRIVQKDNNFYKFQKALDEVLINLAQMIVRDGEGATKFIKLHIKNAKNYSQAKKVAFAIANSPLVKTTFFGEDLNWGRIINAIGYSDTYLDINKVDIYLGNILIVKNCLKVSFHKNKLKKILQEKEIYLKIDLHEGEKELTIWTTDLSLDYVKINSCYPT